MSTPFLLILLCVLLLLSAFFSSSETAMMAINRYRLRDREQKGQRSAILTARLLSKPDSLLGTILLCNNLVNNAATAVTTILALRFFGAEAVAIGTGLITLVILLVSEVPPKTLAALYPDRIAYPASYVLTGLRVAVGPIVAAINMVSRWVFARFNIQVETQSKAHMNLSELRLAINDAKTAKPSAVASMLLGVLDVERITVEDVMVPRNQMESIDLSEGFKAVMRQLATARHTRIPVYSGDINQMHGYIHLRDLFNNSMHQELSSIEDLIHICKQAPFVSNESLLTQHLSSLGPVEFAFVIDEYGDLLGIFNSASIFEKIVGRMDDAERSEQNKSKVSPESIVVNASMEVDELKGRYAMELPNPGNHRTLNGLIAHTIEEIPSPGVKLMLDDYECEVLRSDAALIYTLRITRKSN